MISSRGLYTVPANLTLRFLAPWWMLTGLLVIPAIWLGVRNLAALGRPRQVAAIACRALVILLLAALLARPSLAVRHENLTVVAVVDRSQSVPESLQNAALAYIEQAAKRKPAADLLGLVDVAESASIVQLPGGDTSVPRRNTSLAGDQTRLDGGLQMAMAVVTGQTASRIVLISDGNQTAGDVREVARVAAANHVPIDVLPLVYHYEHEVAFERLVSPPRARAGQTVALRFVLNSTAAAHGRLMLTLNGQPVKLDPQSADMTVPVALAAGVNVRTVSIPLGGRGIHEFAATFIPDGPADDTLTQNNRASAITFVAGPGHVVLVEAGTAEAAIASKPLAGALSAAGLDVRRMPASAFPERLADLLDVDAIILANIGSGEFSRLQQDLLCRYVKDLGGGLVMTGGPDAFGAGGWIGSPVAEVLPVDLDPPQKKEMPKGALVLIMHACEMPQGNFWGKQVAVAAVNALSRLDLVGVLDYGWQSGSSHWVYPLGLVGDRTAAVNAINGMQMGDMPDFDAPLLDAHKALAKTDAAQKHIVIISDGDPGAPSAALINDLRKAGVTVTGVVVFPHSKTDNLLPIAQATGGRYYPVTDPKTLPRIFIKEAQVIRRPLIVNEKFTPRLADTLSETITGLGSGLPQLEGFVLTGAKGGLTQVVLTSPDGEPILATGQVGLGRCAAFTSSADSRWAGPWLAWGGYNRFWEQVVRWAGKSARSADCDVFTDVQGRTVTVTAESSGEQSGSPGSGGGGSPLGSMTGRVIAPDMSDKSLELRQVGPGQYRATFQAEQGGSYLVNLTYRKAGATGAGRAGSAGSAGSAGVGLAQAIVTVPYAAEFEDLTDNHLLLAEVAAMTGGRVLPADPKQANLFAREGVAFPESLTPLTGPLMIAWLVLFLLDVAVRRVVIDFKAVGRWMVGLVRLRWLPWLRRRAGADPTLAQLKARRQQVQKKLTGAGSRAGPSADPGRRFEPPSGSGDEALPLGPGEPEVSEPKTQKPAEPSDPPKEAGAMDQLLAAKRRRKKG